jgi:hypothetical protein
VDSRWAECLHPALAAPSMEPVAQSRPKLEGSVALRSFPAAAPPGELRPEGARRAGSAQWVESEERL